MPLEARLRRVEPVDQRRDQLAERRDHLALAVELLGEEGGEPDQDQRQRQRDEEERAVEKNRAARLRRPEEADGVGGDQHRPDRAGERGEPAGAPEGLESREPALQRAEAGLGEFRRHARPSAARHRKETVRIS